MSLLRTSGVLLCGLAMAIHALALTSCGDPTDRPQDCSANEFFDEAESLCTSCPALTIPSCREGCPLLVSEDGRGCPQVACDLSCSACGEGETFSLETLACEPLCEEGAAFDPVLGVCSTCPRAQDEALPDCAQSDCQCALVLSFDEAGCATPVCGACTAPKDGFAVDAAGLCVEAE